MESFEKRKRERRKQELRKEKAARKLQGLEPSGPSQEDYFADPGATADDPASPDAVEGDDTSADTADPASTKSAQSPPSIEGRGSAN